MRIKGGDLDLKKINNILLVQLGDIGDVVLSFPTIRALHENFPKAKIYVAVREKAKILIAACPWVSEAIIVIQTKRTIFEQIFYQLSFIKNLQNKKFDLVFDLRIDDRGAILTFLTRARQRIGFYSKKVMPWRNKLYTHLYWAKDGIRQYRGEYYLSLLNAAGLNTKNSKLEIPITKKHTEAANSFLVRMNLSLRRPIVAIQPFSLWEFKEWKIPNHVSLINWLISKYVCDIIIIGGEDDFDKANKIKSECPSSVYNLAGKTSLDELPGILSLAKLFIGIDSVGVHIAAAVNTATITIFGPTLPIHWAPHGKQHLVVNKKLDCVPCDETGCQGKGWSRCLEELTVAEVKQAVIEHNKQNAFL